MELLIGIYEIFKVFYLIFANVLYFWVEPNQRALAALFLTPLLTTLIIMAGAAIRNIKKN